MPTRNRTRQLAVESAARPKEARPMRPVLAGRNWFCAIHLRPVLFPPEIESRPRIQDLDFSIWASAKHFFFSIPQPLKQIGFGFARTELFGKSVFRDQLGSPPPPDTMGRGTKSTDTH